MAVIRFLQSLLAVLAVAALVTAAPAPTKTEPMAGDSSPTCVDAAPANCPSDGSWYINYATVTPVATANFLGHYNIDPAWQQEHSLNGAIIHGTQDVPSLYQAFKCQFKCNGEDHCLSFFVGPGGVCALFDTLIDPSMFISDQGTTPFGGYNKLCNPPSWPFTCAGKRDEWHSQSLRRDEKVIGSSKNDVHTSTCKETQVLPVKDWTDYAPNDSFQKLHGHYTFTGTESGDWAGFNTTHTACSKICDGFTWCKSVFISHDGAADGGSGSNPDLWTCVFFDVVLTPDLYTPIVTQVAFPSPYGYNADCSGSSGS